jgi:hypothetical protein
VLEVEGGAVGAEVDQARRISEGEGMQDDGVDDAEDRGVGADAEGEGQDGDGGEAGIFAEGAER